MATRALEGGRVQFDESYPFVDDGPFVLEPEEIAALPPASATRAWNDIDPDVAADEAAGPGT